MSDIDVLLQEDRTFAPPREFRERAAVSTREIYDRAARDQEAFWAEMASTLEWSRPWTRVLQWDPPHAQWFVGGQLNVSVNCLDRHIRTPRRTSATSSADVGRIPQRRSAH